MVNIGINLIFTIKKLVASFQFLRLRSFFTSRNQSVEKLQEQKNQFKRKKTERKKKDFMVLLVSKLDKY